MRFKSSIVIPRALKLMEFSRNVTRVARIVCILSPFQSYRNTFSTALEWGRHKFLHYDYHSTKIPLFLHYEYHSMVVPKYYSIIIALQLLLRSLSIYPFISPFCRLHYDLVCTVGFQYSHAFIFKIGYTSQQENGTCSNYLVPGHT